MINHECEKKDDNATITLREICDGNKIEKKWELELIDFDYGTHLEKAHSYIKFCPYCGIKL